MVYIVIFNNLHQFMTECFFVDIFIMKGKTVKIKLGVNHHLPGEELRFPVVIVWPENTDAA